MPTPTIERSSTAPQTNATTTNAPQTEGSTLATRPTPTNPSESTPAESTGPGGQPGSQPGSQSAGRDATQSAVKHFVLDTNVLLHNPNALFVFEDNHVVVPYPVIEELDQMKRREDDIGRSARQCIRHLDRLRELGSLMTALPWGDMRATPEFNPAGLAAAGRSGTIRIDIGDHARPAAIGKDMPDNRIIAAAYALKLEGERAVFVSKDLSARIKADSLGITSEDFENQKVDADRLYSGYMELTVPGRLIDDLYHDKQLDMARLEPHLVYIGDDEKEHRRQVMPNQYLLLTDADDPNHTGLARRLAGRMAETETIIPVTGPRKPVYGILARNAQQTMAMDVLLDDDIRLVTLLGSAGTGKTLLALAAGMAKVFNDARYEKLLVARPIMPMGRDIGYLPGDKDEKLGAWMQPIFDNLAYLLTTRGGQHETPDSHSTEQRIQRLMADGKLVLEPLTYIRGRSIPHQFMIVDEAQNLTPHEVKTIVSRVGEGTKIVLTGDIGQIDNPYLDQSSNGLSYIVEKMKAIGIVGHITLARSERSELASLASELL